MSTNFDARLGLDYSLDEKTTMGLLFTGYSNVWDMDAQNLGFERINSEQTDFEVLSGEKNQWTNLMANYNFSKQLDNGSLNFDIDYLYYVQDNPTDYNNTFRNSQGEIINQEIIRAEKETPVNIWVSRLDYTKTLSDKINFGAGLKMTISNLDNRVVVENLEDGRFVTDLQLSENASLAERIGGAYSNLNITFSEQTKLNLGLRYEYTDTRLSTIEDPDAVDLNYGNLFPTVFFMQKLNDNWTSQFSYGRRINRPAYNDLAPFVVFIDPNTFFFGNTALQPSFGDNYKVDFIYKKYLLSLQYNNESDAIASYQPTLLPGTNQQVFTSLNLDYRRSYVAMLSIPVTVTKWWDFRVNLMGTSRDILTLEGEQLGQDFFSLNGNMNFRLPGNFSAQIFGYHQTKSISGIAELSPITNISLGIQKKIGNNSSLRFSINNLFGYEYDVFTAENLALDYSTNTNYWFEPNIFRLSFSSSFGNEKLKSARRRNTGSEDIKQRVN
ncbi:MAG: outer membrane beta-barrel family protein [Bacteroidota bacterium]